MVLLLYEPASFAVRRTAIPIDFIMRSLYCCHPLQETPLDQTSHCTSRHFPSSRCPISAIRASFTRFIGINLLILKRFYESDDRLRFVDAQLRKNHGFSLRFIHANATDTATQQNDVPQGTLAADAPNAS